jgi:protein Tex
MEVDIPRQRIGLSMRLDDEPGQARGGRPPANSTESRSGSSRDQRGPRPGGSPKPAAAPTNSAFADAFSRALKR